MRPCVVLLMLGSALPTYAEAPSPAAFAPIGAEIARPTSPEAEVEDELAGLETVSDEYLAGQRGGFTWQGVEIGLGAEIRTFLDGELVLQTNISWTETGAQTSQIVSGALTPADAATLQAGILMSGGITMNVGDSSVFLANEGQTAIVHQTDGAIQNIIINTASGVQASQEVDAVLDLGNFGQFQQDIIDMRVGDAIGDMVGQAIIHGN